MNFGISHRFHRQKIKFRTLAVKNILNLRGKEDAEQRFTTVCEANVRSLLASLKLCHELGIKGFRPPVLFPLANHETLGYTMESLSGYETIKTILHECGEFAVNHDIRITWQPPQHTILGSPREDLKSQSLKELALLVESRRLLGGPRDFIILEIGAAYGSKEETLKRTREVYQSLDAETRYGLAFINDDTIYNYEDVSSIGAPYSVIDIQAHLLNPPLRSDDGILFDLSGWLDPVIRISSIPQGQRRGQDNYVALDDIPKNLMQMDALFEVEANYKEAAVKKLQAQLAEVNV